MGNHLHGYLNLSTSHLDACQLQLRRDGRRMCCIVSEEYFVSFAPQHFRLGDLALIVQDMCSMYMCSESEVSVDWVFC